MELALLIFGIAFAALCVWLPVRIVNRRERWAKWTLAGMTAGLLVYALGFWPACSLVGRGMVPLRPAAILYSPMLKLAFRGPEDEIAILVQGYVRLDDPGFEGLIYMGLWLDFIDGGSPLQSITCVAISDVPSRSNGTVTVELSCSRVLARSFAPLQPLQPLASPPSR